MSETGRVFSRTYLQEANIALSAIDCVLNGEKAIYASTELTSGRLVSAVLRQTGGGLASDLRDRLGDDEYATRVWNPNVAAATAFARRLHHALGGNQIVITPAPFMAPGWNQQEYLSFWRTLILTRIKAVYFNDGWEYSNGCSYELLVALEAGLPTFDATGQPLTVPMAVSRIDAAITDLRQSGLDVETLSRHVGQLLATTSKNH